MLKLSISDLKDSWAVLVYRIRLFRPIFHRVFVWSLLSAVLVMGVTFYGLYRYYRNHSLFFAFFEIYKLTWRSWFMGWIWQLKAWWHGVHLPCSPMRSVVAVEFVHKQLTISFLCGVIAGLLIFLLVFLRANKTAVDAYKNTLAVGSPEWTKKNTIKTIYAKGNASPRHVNGSTHGQAYGNRPYSHR